MYYYYQIYESMTVIITTLVVLAVISAFMKFKGGVYASLVMIAVLLLGMMVKEFLMSFTYGLRSIFFQLNRYMAMGFNVLFTIALFAGVAGLLSLVARRRH